MIILKPSREIIDADVIRELNGIKEYIMRHRPQVLVVPAWVEVIEVNDIKEGEENGKQ